MQKDVVATVNVDAGHEVSTDKRVDGCVELMLELDGGPDNGDRGQDVGGINADVIANDLVEVYR